MKQTSYYRAEARSMLGGQIFSEKWLYALLICLVVSLVNGILSSTGLLIILLGPITAGVAAVFLKMRREGTKADFESLLWCTKENRFVSTLLLGLMETIFLTLWFCLFIIPCIVKSYAYSMSFYIQQDHPEYDWNQCITESRKLMDGKKANLFLLDLSFIGWIIVSLFTLGIGMLWVQPYMEAAHAAFYEDIKAPVIKVEEPAPEPAAE